MKKKNYNPFKMWGSYAGIIAGIISLFFIEVGGEKVKIFCENYIYSNLGNSCVIKITPIDVILKNFDGFIQNEILLYAVLVTFSALVLGFLIGWGIHSLIRRYKK